MSNVAVLMRKSMVGFLVLALGACGGDDGDGPGPGDAGLDGGFVADGSIEAASDGAADAAVPSDASSAGPDGASAATPDSAAGRKLAWLIDLLNGPGEAITAEGVEPHFAPSFLAQLPAPELAALLASMAKDYAPVTFVDLESETPQGLAAIVRVRLDHILRIRLSTGAGERIASFFVQPAPERDANVSTWQGLESRLAGLAPRVGVLVATLGQDGCRTDHALSPDQSQPLGSLFKIYVLGGVLAKMLAGEAAWSDVVTIRESLKSLPSGTLQAEPEGTELAVDFVARKMIQISDNTATDHLIDFVGRERVEQQQAAMGHSQPAINVPFFSTRDLFILKLVAGANERAAYLAADVPARRNILANNATRPLPALDSMAVTGWTAPRDITTLEWFATPLEVCRAFDWLRTKGQEPGGQNALTALNLNPGLPIDQGTFRYIGYKGGSEPGVLALAWLLQRRSDDVWRVVVLLLADPEKPIDEGPALYHALATVQLAGR